MSDPLEAARKAPRKPSPKFRERVDAMCKQCIYDPYSGAGTWRQQTEGCTSTKCPLYDIRPVSTGGGGKTEGGRDE